MNEDLILALYLIAENYMLLFNEMIKNKNKTLFFLKKVMDQ